MACLLLHLITQNQLSSSNACYNVFQYLIIQNQQQRELSSSATCYFSTSLSLAGNLGCPTWVRHRSRRSSATHSYRYVQYFHVQTMVWLPMFGIFNVCTDVDACDCTDTIRECALEADSRRKTLASPGIWTRTSIALAFQLDALPTELFLPPVHRTVVYPMCAGQ